jgi:hypothetical protein
LKQRILGSVLLVLASLHCVSSISYVNRSFISMEKYEAGTEVLPFQGRVLMIPVMRWAHNNRKLNAIADRSNLRQMASEAQTPEKLATTLVGFVCVIGLGLMATYMGRELGFQSWWLPWALVLEILYTGYAARSAQNYWYPYDLPAFFFFGLGTVFVLRRWWLPLVALMPIAAANRETAIFLAFLWVVSEWPRDSLKAVLTGLPVLLGWAAVRLWIWRVYLNVHSEAGSWFAYNLRDMARFPQHLPQMFSAFGFLLPLLYVYRGRLSPASRHMFWAMLVCVAVVVWFGIWTETRVFGEFTLLFAVLAAEAWEKKSVGTPNPTRLEAAVLS